MQYIEYIALTVKPTGGHHLKEGKEHDGHYGSVMVHQLENIDPHLNRELFVRRVM